MKIFSDLIQHIFEPDSSVVASEENFEDINICEALKISAGLAHRYVNFHLAKCCTETAKFNLICGIKSCLEVNIWDLEQTLKEAGYWKERDYLPGDQCVQLLKIYKRHLFRVEQAICFYNKCIKDCPDKKEPTQHYSNSQIPVFKLKTGVMSKTNYLRVINVFSEMRIFETGDEQIAEKKDLMEGFGALAGLDLAQYAPDLSKALSQSEEVNIEIFEKIKNKASWIWNEKLKKENN